MFCKFYLVKNHKNAKKSAAANAREKIRKIWNPYNSKKNYVRLTKFTHNQISLNKISR